MLETPSPSSFQFMNHPDTVVLPKMILYFLKYLEMSGHIFASHTGKALLASRE